MATPDRFEAPSSRRRRLDVCPLSLLLVAASGAPALAQQELTLSDAIAIALSRNRAIAVERETVTQADAGVLRAEGAYDATLRADLRYRYQIVPSTSILSGAPPGELGPTAQGFTGGASWSQLFASGATMSVSGSVTRDTSNSFLTLVSPAWFTALGIEVRQPLLQNREIDPARRAIRVSRVTRERSDALLRRSIAETAAGVERAYWTLVAAARDVEIRRASVALATTQRDDVQSRIAAKVTPESDIAQPTAEIERRKGELLQAVEIRARAEHHLKALMADRADAPIWDVELRLIDDPAMPLAAADLRGALADAQAFRPELAELDARAALDAIEIDAARNRLKPQIDLVGGYTARGLAGGRHEGAIEIPSFPTQFPPDISGGLGTSTELLLRQEFPDASVGISVSVPLGRSVARADLATAESASRQTARLAEQLRLQIAVEVRNAVAALEAAAQSIETARAARAASEIQLQAEQDRFDAGLTTTFLVLTRQNDLGSARQTEAAALSRYRVALAELARARGTILRDRRIEVR
jgi:HAE1 family hydrophobic/amphiphilic exporter-1